MVGGLVVFSVFVPLVFFLDLDVVGGGVLIRTVEGCTVEMGLSVMGAFVKAAEGLGAEVGAGGLGAEVGAENAMEGG